jgi:hypothetical protein
MALACHAWEIPAHANVRGFSTYIRLTLCFCFCTLSIPLYVNVLAFTPHAFHYALVTESHPIFTQDEDSLSPLIRDPGAI